MGVTEEPPGGCGQMSRGCGTPALRHLCSPAVTVRAFQGDRGMRIPGALSLLHCFVFQFS